ASAVFRAQGDPHVRRVSQRFGGRRGRHGHYAAGNPAPAGGGRRRLLPLRGTPARRTAGRGGSDGGPARRPGSGGGDEGPARRPGGGRGAAQGERPLSAPRLPPLQTSRKSAPVLRSGNVCHIP